MADGGGKGEELGFEVFGGEGGGGEEKGLLLGLMGGICVHGKQCCFLTNKRKKRNFFNMQNDVVYLFIFFKKTFFHVCSVPPRATILLF